MSTGRTQRTTYKIIDRILSLTYESQLDLLSALVRDIVDNDRFVMTGGRVWEFDEQSSSYVLQYKYGEGSSLTIGTVRNIHEAQSPFAQLSTLHTYTEVETTETLPDSAREYALTGVGDVLTVDGIRVYRYAIAFTAHTITDELRETMMVAGAGATTSLRHMQSALRERRMQ